MMQHKVGVRIGDWELSGGCRKLGGAIDNAVLTSIMAQLSHGVHTYFMTISGCKSGCLNLSTSTLPCVFPPPISSPRAQIKGRLDLLAPCTSYFWT